MKRKRRAPLTFKRFQAVNLARCNECFGHNLQKWSLAEWSNALAGEVGELCNFTKKMLRGDGDFGEDCAKELADIVTYAFLVAEKLDIDLEEALVDKFNAVSDRIEKSGRTCWHCLGTGEFGGLPCNNCEGSERPGKLPLKHKPPRL